MINQAIKNYKTAYKKLPIASFYFSNTYISFLCPMDRDPRYKLIKPMYEKGEILSFNDIFKFIPKTIVAKDIGKNIARFTEFMSKVQGFTLEELYNIANLCSFTTSQILLLADKQYHKQRSKNLKLIIPKSNSENKIQGP